MRDFPSCFGENGVQIADSSSNGSKIAAQSLVTSLHQTNLCGHPCIITVTWSKSLMGQALTVSIDDSSSNQCISKVDIKPWLFSKRKGSKRLDLEALDNCKVDIFWDFSTAKFGASPEPLEAFFVAVTFDLEMVLLLGDLIKEAYRKTNASPPPSNAVLVAKREHIFGKKFFCTKAQFCDNGQVHDIAIECETIGLKEPWLEIRIDKKRVVQVKRLSWKFRGNQTILIDGLPVEVIWDVHNWLFGTPTGNAAVFMFQTCMSTDKLLHWSSSQILGDSHLQGLGFSLILHAWRHE